MTLQHMIYQWMNNSGASEQTYAEQIGKFLEKQDEVTSDDQMILHTDVPQITIRDRRMADREEQEPYLAYRCNPAEGTAYLSLQLPKDSCQNLTVTSVRSMLLNQEEPQETMHSGCEAYDAACVDCICYTKETLPDDAQLLADFRKMSLCYQRYYTLLFTCHAWVYQWQEDKCTYIDVPELWQIVLTEPNAVSRGDFIYLAGSYADQTGLYARGRVMELSCTENGHLVLLVSFDRPPSVCAGLCLTMNEIDDLYPVEEEDINEILSELPQSHARSLEALWSTRLPPGKLSENQTENEQNGGQSEDEISEVVRASVRNVQSFLESKGFPCCETTAVQMILALKTRPFLILAGTSGSGKTTLSRLFAEAFGASAANGRYRRLSVSADWTDTADLLGHLNLSGQFSEGPLLGLIQKAEEDPSQPYFVCLDDMQAAHTDSWICGLLAVLDTRQPDLQTGRLVTEPLLDISYFGRDREAAERFGKLSFPDNLYLIGTCNTDAVPNILSGKVLDCAHVLLPVADDAGAERLFAKTAQDSFVCKAEILSAEFFSLPQYTDAQKEYAAAVDEELRTLHGLLKKAGSGISFRVRNESIRYLLQNQKYSFLENSAAMDQLLLQRILPKVCGYREQEADMLDALFAFCADGQPKARGGRLTGADQMEEYIRTQNCRYPESAAAVARMTRRYMEDGCTSYRV